MSAKFSETVGPCVGDILGILVGATVGEPVTHIGWVRSIQNVCIGAKETP